MLWIATDRGICTYDGYEFNKPNTHNLGIGPIWRIIPDSQNRLWFIGLQGKFYYWEKGQFHAYPHNSQLRKAYPKAVLQVKYHVSKDTLFFQFDSWSGLYKINTTTLSFHYIPWGSLKSVEPGLRAPFGLTGHMVINTKPHPGYFLFNGQTYAIPPEMQEGTFDAECQYDQKSGGYFKTRNSVGYLNSEKQKIELLSTSGRFLQLEKHHQLIHLCHDNRVSLLADGTIHPLHQLPEGVRVSGCTMDNEGGHWFSTLDHGVFYSPDQRITTALKKNDVSKINYLNVIDSTLYVSSDNGLWTIGPTQRTKHYFPSARIYNVYKPLDPPSQVVCHRRVDQIPSPHHFRLSGTQHFQIGDRLWQLTATDLSYESDNKPMHKVFSGKVNDVVEFEGNWAFSTYEGIQFIAKNDSVFTLKIHPDLDDFYTSSLEAKDSLLLIGTVGRGLYVYNGTKAKGVNSSTSNLPNDYCSHVYVGEDDDVYISTNEGLAITNLNELRSSNPTFKVLDIRDGLASNEVLSSSRFGDYLFIATKNGLDKVHLENLQPKLYRGNYHLAIAKVSAGFENLNLAKEIELPYQQNDISVHFRGICYRCLGNLEYRYRIKGGGEKWNYTTNRDVPFSNLPHGEYQFEVACRGHKMNWSSPVQVSWTILPPFYLTGWFIAIVLLGVFVFLCVALYIFYTRHRLQQKLNSYQYTIHSAQLNPHFIFNSLNAVQNLFLEKRSERGIEYMSQFGRLLRGALKNQSQTLITLKDELEQLELYISVEKLRVRFPLDFTINLDLGHHEINQILVPSMILQPLVENSINHGIKLQEDGKITISISENNNRLRLTVTDNGVGFHSAQKMIKSTALKKSHGLSITQKRVVLMNKMYGVKPSFSITDLSNESGKGTKVEFTLPLLNGKK